MFRARRYWCDSSPRAKGIELMTSAPPEIAAKLDVVPRNRCCHASGSKSSPPTSAANSVDPRLQWLGDALFQEESGPEETDCAQLGNL